MLQVGPASAGARPGPACYGHGGERPTVTDANVVLGRLNPQYPAGRRARDRRRPLARRDREATSPDPREFRVVEAAAAIIAIADTNMAHAVRFVSVERGLDPARFHAGRVRRRRARCTPRRSRSNSAWRACSFRRHPACCARWACWSTTCRRTSAARASQRESPRAAAPSSTAMLRRARRQGAAGVRATATLDGAQLDVLPHDRRALPGAEPRADRRSARGRLRRNGARGGEGQFSCRAPRTVRLCLARQEARARDLPRAGDGSPRGATRTRSRAARAANGAPRAGRDAPGVFRATQDSSTARYSSASACARETAAGPGHRRADGLHDRRPARVHARRSTSSQSALRPEG